MTPIRSLTLGAALAVGARALLPRLLLVKLRRDVAALNAGDHRPFLAAYADDAVLHFNEGEHRWSGDHRGKAAIDRFLRNYTGAGMQGELGTLWLSGPPWALQLAARFDDHAEGPDGEPLYANRVVVVLRTRWGRIVEHDDFYADTAGIAALDAKLTALGVAPV